jgi:methionyl-tRNA synthetase
VIEEAVRRYHDHMSAVALTQALADVWEVVGRANGYLVEKAPWTLKEASRRDELAAILYASAETLRILAVLIQPIMPGAAQRLWDQLGIVASLADQRLPVTARWGGLEPGTTTSKGPALFPRLES